MAELPCAVCGRHLEASDGHPEFPHGADIFQATWHYASTRYDAPRGEHLEVVIGADCLDQMTGQGRVRRVLHPTSDFPGRRIVFGSDEDRAIHDNPFNQLRLRNEAAMVRFLDSEPGMDGRWAARVHMACNESSRAGEAFDPTTVAANG